MDGNAAALPLLVLRERRRQLIGGTLCPHAAQGDVRAILALLTPVAAQFKQRRFQGVVQGAQFRLSLADTDPDDAWPPGVREATDLLHTHFKGGMLDGLLGDSPA